MFSNLDQYNKQKANKKPRGFMQSYFPFLYILNVVVFLAQLFYLLRYYNHKSTMEAAILFFFSEINLRCDWDSSEIKSFLVIG